MSTPSHPRPERIHGYIVVGEERGGVERAGSGMESVADWRRGWSECGKGRPMHWEEWGRISNRLTVNAYVLTVLYNYIFISLVLVD